MTPHIKSYATHPWLLESVWKKKILTTEAKNDVWTDREEQQDMVTSLIHIFDAA